MGENGKLTKSTLQEELENEFRDKEFSITDSEDKTQWIIEVDTVKISVLAGKDTQKNATLPEGWNANVVALAYPNNDATQKAPIPKGFVASGAAGETLIATGLVIYEGTESVTDENVETAKTTRNQYVWIPVTLENWTDEYITKEPIKLSGITDSRESDELLTSMTTDFNTMKTSVETYGGFYISRYELNTDGGSKRGQAVANANLSTSNTWYGLYNLAQREIKYENNTILKGHMIFGSQYDQVINFIGTPATQTHESIADRILTTPQQSGQTQDIMNNIHDLEGNYLEWTAEAYDTNIRIDRGGVFDLADIGVFNPASFSLNEDSPTVMFDNIGSRQALYVEI